MTGKGHVISGSIFMADTFICREILRQVDLSASFHNFITNFEYHINPLLYYDNPELPALKYIMLGIGIFLFYLGVLLPDIDNNSTISNFLKLKIKIKHRGFTHSVWSILIFLIPGLFCYRILLFIAIGMFIHDFVDSLSKAGWVPFYPLGSYKILYEHVVCSKSKHLSLYSSTAKYSELVCNLIFFLTSALIFVIILLVRFYI